MTAPGLLNAAQTARLIGLQPNAFYERRQQMQDQGFPAPHLEFRAGRGQTTRRYWSRLAVEAWLAGRPPVDFGQHDVEDAGLQTARQVYVLRVS